MSASATMRVPAVGESAPDFTLASTAGSMVTLSGFRGQHHVLVAFFPLAFTSVCTAELCSMGDEYDAFTTPDVVVLPISVDYVPSLREFKAKYKMPLDLLSDFRREVSRLYGTLLEEKFFSNRAYVVIDRRGIVRWTHAESTTGSRRENQDLLAELKRLG